MDIINETITFGIPKDEYDSVISDTAAGLGYESMIPDPAQDTAVPPMIPNPVQPMDFIKQKVGEHLFGVLAGYRAKQAADSAHAASSAASAALQPSLSIA